MAQSKADFSVDYYTRFRIHYLVLLLNVHNELFRRTYSQAWLELFEAIVATVQTYPEQFFVVTAISLISIIFSAYGHVFSNLSLSARLATGVSCSEKLPIGSWPILEEHTYKSDKEAEPEISLDEQTSVVKHLSISDEAKQISDNTSAATNNDESTVVPDDEFESLLAAVHQQRSARVPSSQKLRRRMMLRDFAAADKRRRERLLDSDEDDSDFWQRIPVVQACPQDGLKTDDTSQDIGDTSLVIEGASPQQSALATEPEVFDQPNELLHEPSLSIKDDEVPQAVNVEDLQTSGIDIGVDVDDDILENELDDPQSSDHEDATDHAEQASLETVTPAEITRGHSFADVLVMQEKTAAEPLAISAVEEPTAIIESRPTPEHIPTAFPLTQNEAVAESLDDLALAEADKPQSIDVELARGHSIADDLATLELTDQGNDHSLQTLAEADMSTEKTLEYSQSVDPSFVDTERCVPPPTLVFGGAYGGAYTPFSFTTGKQSHAFEVQHPDISTNVVPAELSPFVENPTHQQLVAAPWTHNSDQRVPAKGVIRLFNAHDAYGGQSPQEDPSRAKPVKQVHFADTEQVRFFGREDISTQLHHQDVMLPIPTVNLDQGSSFPAHFQAALPMHTQIFTQPEQETYAQEAMINEVEMAEASNDDDWLEDALTNAFEQVSVQEDMPDGDFTLQPYPSFATTWSTVPFEDVLGDQSAAAEEMEPVPVSSWMAEHQTEQVSTTDLLIEAEQETASLTDLLEQLDESFGMQDNAVARPEQPLPWQFGRSMPHHSFDIEVAPPTQSIDLEPETSLEDLLDPLQTQSRIFDRKQERSISQPKSDDMPLFAAPTETVRRPIIRASRWVPNKFRSIHEEAASDEPSAVVASEPEPATAPPATPIHVEEPAADKSDVIIPDESDRQQTPEISVQRRFVPEKRFKHASHQPSETLEENGDLPMIDPALLSLPPVPFIEASYKKHQQTLAQQLNTKLSFEDQIKALEALQNEAAAAWKAQHGHDIADDDSDLDSDLYSDVDELDEFPLYFEPTSRPNLKRKRDSFQIHIRRVDSDDHIRFTDRAFANQPVQPAFQFDDHYDDDDEEGEDDDLLYIQHTRKRVNSEDAQINIDAVHAIGREFADDRFYPDSWVRPLLNFKRSNEALQLMETWLNLSQQELDKLNMNDKPEVLFEDSSLGEQWRFRLRHILWTLTNDHHKKRPDYVVKYPLWQWRRIVATRLHHQNLFLPFVEELKTLRPFVDIADEVAKMAVDLHWMLDDALREESWRNAPILPVTRPMVISRPTRPLRRTTGGMRLPGSNP